MGQVGFFGQFPEADSSPLSETKMKLNEVKSREELKECGSVDDVRSEIERIVHPFRVDACSYEDLWKCLVKLRESCIGFATGPFISEQAKYVYILTCLEGKQRNRALGITNDHYEDKVLAKTWFRSIAKHVHPDKGGDDRALGILTEIYKIMTEDSAEGEDD